MISGSLAGLRPFTSQISTGSFLPLMGMAPTLSHTMRLLVCRRDYATLAKSLRQPLPLNIPTSDFGPN